MFVHNLIQDTTGPIPRVDMFVMTLNLVIVDPGMEILSLTILDLEKEVNLWIGQRVTYLKRLN